mmetsp:Transcript_16892/g.23813  ORF Transcript_16892/g.23813 Transcript_16892/m.23813 type:complete len:943 (-) Transcript_16892:73-2901(-)
MSSKQKSVSSKSHSQLRSENLQKSKSSGSDSPPQRLSQAPILHHDGLDEPPGGSGFLAHMNNAPESPGEGRPKTPKKAWERSYKKFLKGFSHQQQYQKHREGPERPFPPRCTFEPMISPPDVEPSKSDDSQGSRKLFGKIRSGGNSHSLSGSAAAGGLFRKFSGEHLIPPQQQQESPLLPAHNLSSNNKRVSAGGGPPADTIATPTLLPQRRSERSHHEGGADQESAVRGGHLFQAVFKHRGRSNSGSDRNSEGNLSNSPASTEGHRRISSNQTIDSLDSTLRKGQERTYSPTNARFIQNQTEEHHVNLPQIPSITVTTTAPTNNNKEDLEGTIRGGAPYQKVKPVESGLTALLRNSNGTNYGGGPTAYEEPESNQISQTTEMKKAFTEFHNSSEYAKDSTSAFLGDDSSKYKADYFTTYNQMISRNSAMTLSERYVPPISENSGSLPLPPVAEDVVPLRSVRVLKQIMEPINWQSGKRYLIAPAILASCPIQILTILSGSNENQCSAAFGKLLLGNATVAFVGRNRPSPKEGYGWCRCALVLRQNYLLEYDDETMTNGLPRGFAHLESAVCKPHSDFSNAFELEFYDSPCTKTEKRVLMVRVKSQEERDRWVSCVNEAARLTIDDLYEYDENVQFGKGRYASVYPARRKTSANSKRSFLAPDCAVKIIDKSEFWSRVVKGQERADTLVRETSVQATMSAKCGGLPTFLKIRGFFETSTNVVMELELQQGIDLFQYISKKGVLEETEAAHIMRDVLYSLDAMRCVGIAHRDVKPANILMSSNTDGTAAKVADFGMSTFAGVDGLVHGRCGTPGYVAPEIFNAGIHGGYGNKVDIFSAGVTLYVMLCGYEPFYGESDHELIAANKAAQVDFPEGDWARISADARDLVKLMLQADSEKRISPSQALIHPWMLKNAPSAPWPDVSIGSMTLKASGVPELAACTIS